MRERSGIGCTSEDPNTASLATNLLAQSCVPEEKLRCTPSVRSRVVVCNWPSALKAVGLPT